MTTPDTAILDVDGTLVDSNYHHTLAWFRALRSVDLTCPMWRIHRAIGMGGDKLVAEVAGDDVEDEHGDTLRKRWVEEFEPLLDEIVVFDGARDLIRALHDRGFAVVLASSGQRPHTEHYLSLLDADQWIDDYTASDDVESTKPAPDLLGVALDKVHGQQGVMVGDSVWDCRAAANLDTLSYGLRTGGFSAAELTDAGAAGVYDGLVDLLADLDNTAFTGVPARRGQ